MRTTIDLPDETFRHLKASAALQGVALKTLLQRLLDDGLARQGQADSAAQSTGRSALPRLALSAADEKKSARTLSQLEQRGALSNAGLLEALEQADRG